MKGEIILGIWASLLTIVNIFFAVYSWHKTKQATLAATVISNYINVQQNIGKIPSALRFYGIDPEKLEEVGISAEELAYLIADFSAGQISHYATDPNDTEAYGKTEYRYHMLKSADTRKAWELMENFFSEGAYRDKIKNTIHKIAVREGDVLDEAKRLEDLEEDRKKWRINKIPNT